MVAEEEDVEDHREADRDGEKLPAPQQAPHLESTEGQEWGQTVSPTVAWREVRWSVYTATIRQVRRRDRKLGHRSSRPSVSADALRAGMTAIVALAAPHPVRATKACSSPAPVTSRSRNGT